jgi:hypothetical protein
MNLLAEQFEDAFFEEVVPLRITHVFVSDRDKLLISKCRTGL